MTSIQPTSDRSQRRLPSLAFLQVSALPSAPLASWSGREQHKAPCLTRWTGIVLAGDLDPLAPVPIAESPNLPRWWAGFEASGTTAFEAISAEPDEAALSAARSEVAQPLTPSAKAAIIGATVTLAPTDWYDIPIPRYGPVVWAAR